MRNLFCSHPNSVNETYFQHLLSAFSFAGSLFLAAALCSVHAVLPFVLSEAASHRVRELYQRMIEQRTKPTL